MQLLSACFCIQESGVRSLALHGSFSTSESSDPLALQVVPPNQTTRHVISNITTQGIGKASVSVPVLHRVN